MSFVESLFPTNISYRSRTGAGFETFIFDLDSEAEERVSRRSHPRHEYDALYGIRSYADLQAVKKFFIARRGAAVGFRFKDWGDFTTNDDGRTAPSATDVELGVGDGIETEFQLVKKYTDGGATVTRTIEKPVAATTRIALNDGTDHELPWSGYNFTVNTATGLVSITPAPANTYVVKGGCQFDVPVRFGEEADRVLQATHDDFSSGSIGSIPIRELVNSSPVSEEDFPGGAYRWGAIAADVSTSLSLGRCQSVQPTVTSLKFKMPVADDLRTGGPIMFVKNEGSYAIALCASDGTSFYSLPTSTVAEVLLSEASGGSKTWWGK